MAGMLRQHTIAERSWEWIRNELPSADWFLSTWDRSAEGHSSVFYDVKHDAEEWGKRIFTHVNITDYNSINTVSTATRNGINSLRYLWLLKHFAAELVNYERIIVLRPDTFTCVYDVTHFKQDCLCTDAVVSHIWRGPEFIQDFMLVVPPKYFKHLDELYGNAVAATEWNPHIGIPLYCAKHAIAIRGTQTYDCTLVRPLSRNVVNPTIKQIDDDRVRWDRLHFKEIDLRFTTHSTN